MYSLRSDVISRLMLRVSKHRAILRKAELKERRAVLNERTQRWPIAMEEQIRGERGCRVQGWLSLSQLQTMAMAHIRSAQSPPAIRGGESNLKRSDKEDSSL